MSFLRYPNYKDSGVEWLGQVPEHWGVQPLYSSVVERFEPNIGMIEENLLSLSYGRIVSKDITSNDGLLPESFETYQVVRPGDIVFRLTDLQNDKRSLRSAIVEETGIITSAYLAVIPRGANPKYMNYLFRAYDTTKVFYSMGGGLRQSMKFADLKRMPTLLPPTSEQIHIAAFLSRETAKIDQLVAEQRRLVDLLKEKRQAVISHAVTNGLNPHVTMKPSGIEWLGDVPKHWKIARLSYNASVENGTTPSKNTADYWLDGDIPWLSSGEVNQYRITEAAEFITKRALEECSLRLLPRGTIVIGMIGQGRTRGLAASLEIEASINQNLAAILPSANLNSDYLLYILQSMYEYLREFGRGGNQAALNCEILSALKVPLPPIEEQLRICDYLCTRLNEFGTLTTVAQRSIELLQERRTALISAAVTGQIDVRELVRAEAA
jgi:type I restriction enzyme S subunit